MAEHLCQQLQREPAPDLLLARGVRTAAIAVAVDPAGRTAQVESGRVPDAVQGKRCSLGFADPGALRRRQLDVEEGQLRRAERLPPVLN